MTNGVDESGILRLGDLGAAREQLASGDFRGAWTRCVDAIRERPFHPEAVRLAGEIAQASGDIATARLCFERAAKMAPGLKSPRLESSAKTASAKAWPGAEEVVLRNGPWRLSVCLIVKNEETFIKPCLLSVLPIATEVILMDTGSTDRTAAIAEELGAKVFHFPWVDDFSAARNASLIHARGDWILILDADEELTPGAGQHLMAEMANPKALAYKLPRIDEGQEEEGLAHYSRLFRNIPGGHYQGRVHEQFLTGIIEIAKDWGLGVETSRATLLHHGYTTTVSANRDKPARNLRLLQQALEEAPNDALTRAYLLTNLGLETVRTGHLPEGISHYEKALALLNSIVSQKSAVISPEFRATFLHQLAPYYHRAGRVNDVIALYQTALGKCGNRSASDHYQLGLAFGQAGQCAEAAREFSECLAKRRMPSPIENHAIILGIAPFQCLARALTQLQRAGEAERVYERGLKEHPQSVELALDYARFKFAQGRTLDALRDAHQQLAANPQSVESWCLGAEIMLSDARFVSMAVEWTAEAVQRHPSHLGLSYLRAESLLVTGDGKSAVALLKTTASDSSPRSLATRLFCFLLDASCECQPFEPSAEVAISRAFLDLFRRVGLNGQIHLAAQAKSQISRLPLPTAADVLRKIES
jgi:tetratricopeptide (TPR) repeat protein